MPFFDYPEFDAAFPLFFPILVTVFGTMIGSFLNVVIYRLPLDKSIVTPGSHCACGAPIRWYDNIPVLTWFARRGKARCCGRAYSFRYPFVEALTGVLFFTCWSLFPPAHAVSGMLFVACLICATFIDVDHMIIPDVFTIGLGIVGVIISVFVPSLHGYAAEPPLLGAIHSGGDALIGMFVGSGLLIWIAITAEAVLRKEAMGFGDVKLIGAIGAFCGWQGALFSIFGGAVVGTVWVGLAWLAQKIFGRTTALAPRAETPEGEVTELAFGAQVPFGPMLAIAGLLHFLWFKPWLAAYLAPFHDIFR
jgi:leader peptidase (prepilin peptidase) / N-methyltransferase